MSNTWLEPIEADGTPILDYRDVQSSHPDDTTTKFIVGNLFHQYPTAVHVDLIQLTEETPGRPRSSVLHTYNRQTLGKPFLLERGNPTAKCNQCGGDYIADNLVALDDGSGEYQCKGCHAEN